MEQEVRNFQVEFKADDEKRIIEGRAIPFNIYSPDREGFREMITPEAVEGVIEKSDIKFLYNHDRGQGFLARNNKGKGTLKIDVREDGVYFSFKAKKDNLSNYVYDRIASGELDEMSWAFTIADGGDKWIRGTDGVWERTITKFERLYDFSACDNSYYGISNAVGCKRYAEVLAEEEAENQRKLEELEREEQIKREQEEAEKEAHLAEYYKNLKEEYGIN